MVYSGLFNDYFGRRYGFRLQCEVDWQVYELIREFLQCLCICVANKLHFMLPLFTGLIL